MSREKQDDWKRTQVRMPQDQYDDVVKYAEQNNLSLNSAMLELIEKGLKRDVYTYSNLTYQPDCAHPFEHEHGVTWLLGQEKKNQYSDLILEFIKYFEEKGYKLEKKTK